MGHGERVEQLEGGRHAWQWLARRLWPVVGRVLWQRREMCGRRRREDDEVPGRWGRVPEVRVRVRMLVLSRGRSGQCDVARGARRCARLRRHVRVGVHAVVALARERRRALADGTVRAVVMAGTRDGHDGGVVREEVRLGDGEVPVEDVEELALDAADIALAKDAGAERPVDVLEGGVVEILQGGWVRLDDEERKERRGRTLLATMSAPRKTRSQAHCSRAIWRWGFARAM